MGPALMEEGRGVGAIEQAQVEFPQVLASIPLILYP